MLKLSGVVTASDRTMQAVAPEDRAASRKPLVMRHPGGAPSTKVIGAPSSDGGLKTLATAQGGGDGVARRGHWQDQHQRLAHAAQLFDLAFGEGA